MRHESKALGKKDVLELTVVFYPRETHGRYENRLECLFKDNASGQKFIITRLVCAAVGSEADLEELQPVAVSSGHASNVRIGYNPADIVLGEAPEPLRAIPWVRRLEAYNIPEPISTVLAEGKLRRKIDSIQEQFLPETLSIETYTSYWQVLLHVEEYQMDEDLDRFDMAGVRLSKRGRYYFLTVPGLAEKRPSVMIGDLIIAVSSQGKPYGGYVHVVENLQVGLSFHSSFPGESGQLYDIEFSLCRIPLQRMHQALSQQTPLDRLLAPNHFFPASILPGQLTLYNTKIADNPPQHQAVTSIVSQPPGSTPFIVFGPPGTGKTVTIVEAILQILDRDPGARILACAPSNSAADIIAHRLIEFGKLGKAELFRLIAPSRSPQNVPEDLLPFTCVNAAGIFTVPNKGHVAKFRVVVSTCVTACVPFGIGVRKGNYSHIFIDEAGQAMEPEVMIAIKTMANAKTNVILSGDPKQLGPVIHSPIARALGLEKSYLERLMELSILICHTSYIYRIVKLTKNYRSHPAILTFPNDMFYHGELEAYGNPSVINRFLNWRELGNKRFPVIFHGITGKDTREGRSPSYFNPDEASLVKYYVKKLKQSGLGERICMTDTDIGIIAPYSAQCGKIRTLLKANPDISVGSAEQFQGQERMAMIISTVRSSRDEIEFDLRHTLGFVANPRRFNVAITRAKALLIVVGDPFVLGLDSVWRQFMDYVRANGGWKGAAVSTDMGPDSADDGYNSGGNDDDEDGAGGHSGSGNRQGQSYLEQLIAQWTAIGSNALGDDENDGEEMGVVAADVPWRERSD
ncbi:hypothetical protein BOTBODRAFT_121476 [Botryobasidium botryosum FD-172 SS1]|uniref:RNA helicase n=1 Tax=Botryobasidium botryosum (strain FD-172 SS1) TaxID=930990 RepID=A0A067M4H1_BOTB1|nr:hypothetical protein BOTBODRAFT_121476 [Botryobasidium botryosum FD-172 SS1]